MAAQQAGQGQQWLQANRPNRFAAMNPAQQGRVQNFLATGQAPGLMRGAPGAAPPAPSMGGMAPLGGFAPDQGFGGPMAMNAGSPWGGGGGWSPMGSGYFGGGWDGGGSPWARAFGPGGPSGLQGLSPQMQQVLQARAQQGGAYGSLMAGSPYGADMAGQGQVWRGPTGAALQNQLANQQAQWGPGGSAWQGASGANYRNMMSGAANQMGAASQQAQQPYQQDRSLQAGAAQSPV